jgi:hypothetical protein
VISSFIFAFGIILAQTLAELGIYDEDAGAFRFPRGISGSAAPPSSSSAGQGGWTEEEPVTVPAPLLYGVCVWWGFHLIVMCLWGFFYARRMLIDPRKRVCMGRRWGQDGCDWFEPELNSMRNLLIHIGIGQDRAKQPPGPTRQPTNRQVPTPGGVETQITSSGVSTELSSMANSHAGSPREHDSPLRGVGSPPRTPPRSWGPEGYCGTARSPQSPASAVRM